MKRRSAAVGTRAGRAVRGLWPDRNPLRRGLDRLEAVVAAGLAVVFLAGAPVAAVVAAHLAYGVGSHTARSQQAAWHHVPAVLLEAAVASRYTAEYASARARWTAPDGTSHTGIALAPPGTPMGSTVRVWVDGPGRLTGPPLQLAQVRSRTVLAAALAPAAVALIVLCTGLLAHAVLERRRAAAWETDWGVTEPHWTRRH